MGQVGRPRKVGVGAESDGASCRIGFSVSPWLYERAREDAEEDGVSLAEWIRERMVEAIMEKRR